MCLRIMFAIAAKPYDNCSAINFFQPLNTSIYELSRLIITAIIFHSSVGKYLHGWCSRSSSCVAASPAFWRRISNNSPDPDILPYHVLAVCGSNGHWLLPCVAESCTTSGDYSYRCAGKAQFCGRNGVCVQHWTGHSVGVWSDCLGWWIGTAFRVYSF